MSRLLSLADIARDVCSTCDGVLRLQARWTRVQGSGASRHESLERMCTEARWFAMTLAKVRPCPSHGSTLRLAEELAGELEVADLFRDTRMECG